MGFEGISDRNQIENFRNVLLLADVDIHADSTEDDFHVQELLGCIVTTDSGLELGPVIEVVNLPGQDLLAVEYNGKDVLIPCVKAIVPDVDVVNKKIRVIPPEGLLDE